MLQKAIPLFLFVPLFPFLFYPTFFSHTFIRIIPCFKSRFRLSTVRSDLQFYRMQVQSRRHAKFKPVDTVCLFSPNTCSSNRAFHLTVFEYWILLHSIIPQFPQNLLRTANREPFPHIHTTPCSPPFENHHPSRATTFPQNI